jgi:chromosome segregation ATPase
LRDMPQETSNTPETEFAGRELERELDRLSLEQALRDLEAANARVVELTERLLGVSRELTDLRADLVTAEEAVARARHESDTIRATMVFQVASIVRRLARRWIP